MASAPNPLLDYAGLPPFAQIRDEHVAPAVREALVRATAALETAERDAAPTWEAAVVALDRLGDGVERVWSVANHLMAVRNSPELRAAYEEVEPDVVAFGLRVAQSEPIYGALVGLRDTPGFGAIPRARQRIVETRIRDAELGGIGLEGEARERFNQIAAELSAIQTRFSNNVLDATSAWSLDLTAADEIAGLPSSLRAQAAALWSAAHPDSEPATADAGPWRITLAPPVVRPFLEYADRRDLREQVWRGFVTRASHSEHDNTPLLDRILSLRAEMADLLGYANYAELSLASKMADLAGVDAMHRRLRDAAWAPALRERAEVEEYAATTGEAGPLHQWDAAYWRRRIRDDRYAFSYEDLKPYFPLPRVLDGLFALLERIFGVTIRDGGDAVETWHDDVRYYTVHDETGRTIAGFYLDAYSRPSNKRGGAWMAGCQQRWVDPDAGLDRLPVAYLNCNGAPAVGDVPSLMSFEEVETLFHEFGHGLQHMLTRVDEPGASGIANVEWDAVELPSQFMENWCYDRRTIGEMTAHYETGETLPDALFAKLREARNYSAATYLLRQVLLGSVDVELHARYTPGAGRTPLDVFFDVGRTTSPWPLEDCDRTLCSFSHIFDGGYAAGYYSYKWAEVLSADAFGAFEEAGLDDLEALETTGRRFRDTVLGMGGAEDPMRVFATFRGREPEPDALLRSYGLLPSA